MAERFPLARIPASSRGIAQRLREAGHEAWYVGGVVREGLLELTTDSGAPGSTPAAAPPAAPGIVDIATSATPDQVQALFRRTVPIGIEHGTVAVLDEAGTPHEVTTFRRDVTTDGRHATVAFGVSLDDDLARRDFTINAVAVHPESGAIHDPFGGRADLDARTVRAVGDAATRFREDRLRVLRALRFAATLGFDIEPATWQAVVQAAGDLAALSRERVRDEWLKSLAGALPSTAVALWRRAGVLAEVWPELATLAASADRGLDQVTPRDPVLVTAAALARADAGPEAARAAVQRLRFSNQDIERVRAVVGGLAAGLPPASDPPALRRWLSARQGAALDIVGAAVPGEATASLRVAVEAALASGVPLSLADLAVRGADLQEAGIVPGPAMGKVLRQLLADVLEEPARNTREHLLSRARELV